MCMHLGIKPVTSCVLGESQLLHTMVVALSSNNPLHGYILRLWGVREGGMQPSATPVNKKSFVTLPIHIFIHSKKKRP